MWWEEAYVRRGLEREKFITGFLEPGVVSLLMVVGQIGTRPNAVDREARLEFAVPGRAGADEGASVQKWVNAAIGQYLSRHIAYRAECRSRQHVYWMKNGVPEEEYRVDRHFLCDLPCTDPGDDEYQLNSDQIYKEVSAALVLGRSNIESSRIRSRAFAADMAVTPRGPERGLAGRVRYGEGRGRRSSLPPWT